MKIIPQFEFRLNTMTSNYECSILLSGNSFFVNNPLRKALCHVLALNNKHDLQNRFMQYKTSLNCFLIKFFDYRIKFVCCNEPLVTNCNIQQKMKPQHDSIAGLLCQSLIETRLFVLR